MTTATIFNIQRFSIHDGPGIRTSVFFKGCPLRCLWCHNPEGLEIKPEIGYSAEKCIGCRLCRDACPRRAHRFDEQNVHIFSREVCSSCGACASACVAGALEYAGRAYTVDEVLSVVLRDAPFYETSGGGITLTGGEPTLQYEFASALLKAAKASGLHVCLETCGFCETERILALGDFVDLFLFDIKELDPVLHRRFTGVDNALILENLKALDRRGAKIILRCPMIPSMNMRPEHFWGIAELANGLRNVQAIELEPYHPLGLSKRERFGKTGGYENGHVMDKSEAEEWVHRMEKITCIPVRTQ